MVQAIFYQRKEGHQDCGSNIDDLLLASRLLNFAETASSNGRCYMDRDGLDDNLGDASAIFKDLREKRFI